LITPSTSYDSLSTITEPSIVHEEDNLYAIRIPNKPFDTVFKIQLLNADSTNLPIISTFYKSPNKVDNHLLENHYPIYDNIGQCNATLITKRHYNPIKIANAKNPALISTYKTEHNNDTTYSETQKVRISDIQGQYSMLTPSFNEFQYDRLPNAKSLTLLKPLKISHSISISGQAIKTPVKNKTYKPLKKFISSSCPPIKTKPLIKKVPKPITPQFSSQISPNLNPQVLQTSTPTPNPAPVTNSPPLKINPTQFLQNWFMIQSVISQLQQNQAQTNQNSPLE